MNPSTAKNPANSAGTAAFAAGSGSLTTSTSLNRNPLVLLHLGSHAMKNLLLLVAAGLAIFSESSGRLPAEAPPPPAAAESDAPLRIALIDVSKLFKESSRFKERVEEMKKEVTEAENKMKQQNSVIAASEEQLKNTEKGTNAYSDLEEKITMSKTALTMDIQKQRKDFIKKESSLYATFYQEFEGEVHAYAREKRLNLVLRFTSDEMKIDLPDSVMTYINRPIVWHDQKLDITPEILKRIEAKAKKSEKTKKNEAPEK
jgi:Skp family chaperone for outer membrane proteins